MPLFFKKGYGIQVCKVFFIIIWLEEAPEDVIQNEDDNGPESAQKEKLLKEDGQAKTK